MKEQTAGHALARTSCLDFRVGDRNVVNCPCTLMAKDATPNNRGNVRYWSDTVQLLEICTSKLHGSPTSDAAYPLNQSLRSPQRGCSPLCRVDAIVEMTAMSTIDNLVTSVHEPDEQQQIVLATANEIVVLGLPLGPMSIPMCRGCSTNGGQPRCGCSKTTTRGISPGLNITRMALSSIRTGSPIHGISCCTGQPAARFAESRHAATAGRPATSSKRARRHVRISTNGRARMPVVN